MGNLESKSKQEVIKNDSEASKNNPENIKNAGKLKDNLKDTKKPGEGDKKQTKEQLSKKTERTKEPDKTQDKMDFRKENGKRILNSFGKDVVSLNNKGEIEIKNMEAIYKLPIEQKAQLAQLIHLGKANTFYKEEALSDFGGKDGSRGFANFPLDENVMKDNFTRGDRQSYLLNDRKQIAIDEFDKMFKPGETVPLMPDVRILATGSGFSTTDATSNLWKTKVATEYGSEKLNTPTINAPILKTERKLSFAPGKNPMKISFNTLSAINSNSIISLNIGGKQIVGTYAGEKIVWSGAIQGVQIDQKTNTITIPRSYQNQDIKLATENKNKSQVKKEVYVTAGGEARYVVANTVEDVTIQTSVEGGRVRLPNEGSSKDQITNPFEKGSTEISPELSQYITGVLKDTIYYGTRTKAIDIPLELNITTDKIKHTDPIAAKNIYKIKLEQEKYSLKQSINKLWFQKKDINSIDKIKETALNYIDSIRDTISTPENQGNEKNTTTPDTKITTTNKNTESTPMNRAINQINASKQPSLDTPNTATTQNESQAQIEAQSLLTQIRLTKIIQKIYANPEFTSALESGKFKLNITHTPTENQRAISIKAPSGFDYIKA